MRTRLRNRILFRLIGPASAAIARQLAHPSGWFGRHVMTRMLNRGNRDLIEATLDQLQPGPDDRLLDVGFGGALLLELARARGVRRLAGLDPSEAAVERLRRRPPRWAAGAELRLEQGVVQSMPFDAAGFDAVASTNTVYFWPDLAPAFAELKRVLRPGGRLALGFSSSTKLVQFGNVTRHGFHFHENAKLAAAAASAGFKDVRLVPLQGGNTDGDYVLVATA